MNSLFKRSVASATFIFLVGLTGCSSTQTIAIDPYVKPQPSQTAVVYLYRDVTMPTKVNLDIKIDGEKVGLLPPNRFTWMQVAAGKHVISAGYPSFPDMSAKKEVVLEKGKSYLFKYLSSSGGGTMPIFGANGHMIGMIPTGPQAWTLLQQENEESIQKIEASHQYVRAQVSQN